MMLDMLKKHGKKLLISIDEVMHNTGMRRFAGEFQIMLRNDYECFLLMTRPYENIYAIQNDPMLTFLLRSPKITLDPSVGRIYDDTGVKGSNGVLMPRGTGAGHIGV